MVDPIIVARSQHQLSRRDIDPDALRVLYRLHHANFAAYLVGGSVRDLLLGRRPKDFDVGTSAHPYQVKKLFRNCWIIGRRFRLAHVKFGDNTIEVATFRRNVPAGSEAEPPIDHTTTAPPVHEPVLVQNPGNAAIQIGEGVTLTTSDQNPDDAAVLPPDRLVHHDNTFGTPEEDAFRRDFTVNALFYDIATFSIIDYTGGLRDLEARVIRCIGDPDERFLEDPVRMLRAIVLSARLGFTVDPPILDAIRRHAPEIEKSAPARLIEEFYKILRSGSATDAFRALGETGLLRHLSPEIETPLSAELEASLDALDDYRRRFDDIPETLTNPILLGSLIVPLGLMKRRPRRHEDEEPHLKTLPRLGHLPVARKDVERLAHILMLQPRLLDTTAPPRKQHGVLRRPSFRDALTWMEIHGQSPDVLAYWRELADEVPHRRRHEPAPIVDPATDHGDARPRRRRRRRRRRGPTA